MIRVIGVVILLGLGCTFWQGCVPPSEEPVLTDINLNVKDTVLQSIWSLQDKQEGKSLLPYFKHKNPTYRYASVLAFASIQDTSLVDSVAILLKDRVLEVRNAAAYAIGQTGGKTASYHLVQAYEKFDTARLWASFNGTIMESIGKVGDTTLLNFLATTAIPSHKDTALLLGQSSGLFHYMLRGMYTPTTIKRNVEVAVDKKMPEQVRLYAAQTLARLPLISLDSTDNRLERALGQETSPSVRMAIALAIGKLNHPVAIQTLKAQYNIEKDYRVQVNILKALDKFPYYEAQPLVLQAITSPNRHIRETAADYFVNHSIGQDAGLYYRLAKDSTVAPKIQLRLLAAANKVVPLYMEEFKGRINYETKKRFESITDPYLKAEAIRSLGAFGWNFRYIKEKAFVADHPAVRVAGMEAINDICNDTGYNAFFGLGARRVTKEISFYLMEAFQIGDPGMIAVASNIMQSTHANFKVAFDSLNFIDDGLAKLKLPKDIEAYNEAIKAKRFLTGDKTIPLKTVEYNHPIDFSLLNILPETPKATILTSKGKVVIELYPTKAPGTVSNFIQLAKSGFFKDKSFHRVVPNFVVQGGCPRGDGYGGEDYTIRSEFGFNYYDKEGFVGMASAGPNTECTQFFVTHSPALHLNGKYSIFGKVIEGMDFVHQLQQGDKIIAVTIN